MRVRGRRVLLVCAAVTVLPFFVGSTSSNAQVGGPPDAETSDRLVAVREPIAITDQAIGNIAELRASLGLRSDRPFIVQLYGDPVALDAVRSESQSARFAGLIVARSEVASVDWRSRVAAAQATIEAAIRREFGNGTYQTAWLDSSAGANSTVLHIYVGDNQAQIEAVARDAVADDLKASVVVHETGITGTEFRDLATSITVRLGGNRERPWGPNDAVGIHLITADLRAARLVVEVTNSVAGDAAAAILQAEFSNPSLEVRRETQVELTGNPTCNNGTWKCDWNWVYAGLAISDQYAGCTSAIAVRYGGGTLPAFLTAGHCLPNYPSSNWSTSRWSQGAYGYNSGYEIGWNIAREYLDGYNTHVDGLILDAGLVYNNVAGSRPGIGRMHNSIHSTATVLSGVVNVYSAQTVCNTGWASTGYDGLRYINDGVRCGYIFDINYVQDGYGQWWPFRAWSTHTTQPGDSGGLIYGGDSSGATAVGITSGYSGQSCWNGSRWISNTGGYPCKDTVFSPLATTMAVWGLTFQTG